MSYLLDTCVVSQTRKKKPNAGAITWLEAVSSEELYISVLVLGELKKGEALLRNKDTKAAESLEKWIQETWNMFFDRILPVDEEVSVIWGEFNAIRPLPAIDSLMAATAKKHGMTMVTGNDKDLKGLDIPIHNPFSSE